MIKYLYLIFFVILFFFSSCSNDNSPLSLTNNFVTRLDYHIYSMVLNKVAAEEPSHMILLSDSTVHWDIAQMYESILTNNSDLDEETLDNYQSINEERVRLSNISNLNFECIVIPEGLDWKKQFPEASGVYFLSRVGYNLNHTQALVYVSAYSAPLVATGSLIFLEKEKSWIIKKTIIGWIS